MFKIIHVLLVYMAKYPTYGTTEIVYGLNRIQFKKLK